MHLQNLQKHADHHMQNNAAETLHSAVLGASFGKEKSACFTCIFLLKSSLNLSLYVTQQNINANEYETRFTLYSEYYCSNNYPRFISKWERNFYTLKSASLRLHTYICDYWLFWLKRQSRRTFPFCIVLSNSEEGGI